MRIWGSAVLAGSVMLAGCVSQVLVDFPKPVTGERSTVIIYRENVFGGRGLSAPISLDGRGIATIMVEYRLELAVKPGMHVIGVGNLNMPIPMEAGKTYYLSIDPSTTPVLQIKTQKEAAPRIATTYLLATNRQP